MEDSKDNEDSSATQRRTNFTSSVIGTGRLEAFSDGVMAVIITIMVLELRPPDSADIGKLLDLRAKFLIYLLSFTFIGIYWNNHHHLLRATRGIDGNVMWANLHLLFWLSLIPFVTAWAGDHPDKPWPVGVYGAIGLLAGIAYYILERTIIRANKGTDIESALNNNGFKDKISLALYAAGVLLTLIPAPIGTLLAFAAYTCVSVIWIIPDRRLTGATSERE
jgi:uncharacterized membrane protein